MQMRGMEMYKNIMKTMEEDEHGIEVKEWGDMDMRMNCYI